MKFLKVDKITINLVVTIITFIIVIVTEFVSIPIKDSEVESEVLHEETAEESLNYTLTESVLPKEYELIVSDNETEMVYILTAVKISYDYENNSYTIETDRGILL